MKKLIALAVMFFVASFAFDASAQIVGKWKKTDLSSINVQGAGEVVKCTMSFMENGAGEMEAELKLAEALDGGYKLDAKVEVEVDYTWTLSGNVLYLNICDVDFDVDDLTLTPYSSELAEIVAMMENMLEAELEKNETMFINETFGTEGRVDYEYIDDNTIRIAGETMTRIR